MSRAREAARLIGNNTFTIDSNNNVGLGSTLPGTKFELGGNARTSGVITATTAAFVGTAVTIRSTGVNVTGVTTSSGGFVGNVTGNATGLSGTPNITVNNVTSGNINSSGIVTATAAIVGSNVTIRSTGVNVTGVVTATSFAGSGSNLTGLPAGYSDLDNALFG
jgi:hypothetical protein